MGKAYLMTKTFKRTLGSLDSIFEFIEKFIIAHTIDKDTAFAVNVAVEEIFTNLVKYDSTAAPDIPIDLSMEGNRVIMVVRNIGGARFDVSAEVAVDVEAPLRTRPIGGLGLHIVHSVVDDIRYEYAGGVGIITITKSMEAKRA